MCRNIKTLFNFDPPATDDEVRDAALQFVRKLSGMRSPSGANGPAFTQAVDSVTDVAHTLLDGLVTHALPKDRQAEVSKLRARNAGRFN
jgi:hypothetical protein